jgi:hypothetical protein
MFDGSVIATIASILALAVSVVSLSFARRSWRETYRPIVTARVRTQAGGNVAILYDLVVENTGNRPATNVRLVVDPRDLKRAMKPGKEIYAEFIKNCFEPKYAIPVLANGQSVSSAFGKTSEDAESNWIPFSRIPIVVHYDDLEGKKYQSKVTLFVFYTAGFAGAHYADPPKHDRGKC